VGVLRFAASLTRRSTARNGATWRWARRSAVLP